MMEKAPHLQSRIFFVAAIFVATAMVVVYNLAHWQIVAPRKGNLSGGVTWVPAPRGNIFDSTGHLLATDIPEYDVKFSPNVVSDDTEQNSIADQIASILRMPRSDVLKMVRGKGKNDKYEPITVPGEGVPQDVKQALAGIKGVDFDMYYQRVYPEGSLAAQTLGFTTNSEQQVSDGTVIRTHLGTYGIEATYDKLLEGTPGYQNLFGYLPEVVADPTQSAEPIPGADLYLTINRAAQKVVEDELAMAIAKYGAESGRVLVMNPRTGEILALANYPTFDLNDYAGITDYALYNNDSVSAIYEPGSVFKAFTMAGALDAHVVGPGSTLNDTGTVQIGNRVIYNADRKAHGTVDMTTVLAKSLNVGTAVIANNMGADTFYRYVDAFGFGKLTGVDLPGEVTGEYPAPGTDYWFKEAHAYVSFGQGIATTPLQIITAFCAIANNGVMMKPRVVQKVVQHHPERTIETQPQVLNRPISADTADILTQMLVNAIEQSNSEAQIDGYKVAGKTGTSQVVSQQAIHDPNREIKYSQNETIHSFAGFFPADDPQLAILVILDKPAFGEWGSHTAAPTFSRIGAQLARIFDIPPDNITVAQR